MAAGNCNIRLVGETDDNMTLVSEIVPILFVTPKIAREMKTKLDKNVKVLIKQYSTSSLSCVKDIIWSNLCLPLILELYLLTSSYLTSPVIGLLHPDDNMLLNSFTTCNYFIY